MAVLEATTLMVWTFKLSVAACLAVLGSGCSSLAYYGQAIGGHWEVLQQMRPIQQVIDDPTTASAVREQLLLAIKARRFAHSELGLSDNGSYRSYVDLGRRYVVWNVVATPEFSLTPKQWCYPIAGCLVYRGFYQHTDAQAEAKRLRAAGFDVAVGGVRAYSTLGWFADPVLNTMLEPARPYLASVMFHELTHEHLYLPGDTKFNESLAVFVEQQGTQRWLATQADQALRQRYAARLDQRRQFLMLVRRYQGQLQQLYQSALAEPSMRVRKSELFAKLRADYQQLADTWSEPRAYAGFFDEGLNNARLASVATYFGWLTAFAQMFDEVGGDFPRFYERCRALAQMTMAKRHRYLNGLVGRGTTSNDAGDSGS